MPSKLWILGIIATCLLIATPALGVAVAGQTKADIVKLTATIDAGQKEITVLDDDLEKTTKEIIFAYQKLDEQELALKRHRKLVNARIQEVYKNYDEFVLEVFIGAPSFNDVWKRMEFLAKINQADHKILAANSVRVEEVRQLKLELARKKQQQIELRRQKQMEFLQLQQSLMEKKRLLEAQAVEAVGRLEQTGGTTSRTSALN